MKRISFSFLFIILIFVLPVYASSSHEDSIKNYYKYFEFSKPHKIFIFKELSKPDYKNLSANQKNEYKFMKKLDTKYKKGLYNKILLNYPNFTPAIFALYNQNKTANYHQALNYLYKIKNIDTQFDKNYINELIFEQLYKLKEYEKATQMYWQIYNKTDYDNFILSDCYLELNKYPQAISYAMKIIKQSTYYYAAQEVLFKAYYRQNNIEKAKQIARNLIYLKPNIPDNYIRYATCSSDINEKLKNYYLARNYANNLSQKLDINSEIINLEQSKIDKIYRTLNIFVEKPDWLSIRESIVYLDEDYWINRQDDFFKSLNNCTSKYRGNEQAKCFASVNSKQNKLSMQLYQQIKDAKEEAYRRQIIQQNEQMIMQQKINNIQQMNQNIQLQNLNNTMQQRNYQLQNTNYQLQNTNFQLQQLNNRLYY